VRSPLVQEKDRGEKAGDNRQQQQQHNNNNNKVRTNKCLQFIA